MKPQQTSDAQADRQSFEAHPKDFHHLGDGVLILGHWRARGRAGGVEIENQAATWLCEVEGGKIVRWRAYTERAEALEAAGLRE